MGKGGWGSFSYKNVSYKKMCNCVEAKKRWKDVLLLSKMLPQQSVRNFFFWILLVIIADEGKVLN